ncbi:hypothetical protein H1Q63_21075 [Desmonostoc muscorum CCALA 125]|nr:hypothetical protein [Desmonostoc muscorum CCALA 125]
MFSSYLISAIAYNIIPDVCILIDDFYLRPYTQRRGTALPCPATHVSSQRETILLCTVRIIAVPIQMRYNIMSPGVGARHCRAPTGVPHACR